jgi:hypothetical protein
MFRACEIRQPLGRIQEFDFNVSEALKSPVMQKEIEAIPKANCWCTHSCFITDSLKFAPKVLLFKIPWTWLKTRMRRFPELSVDDLAPFQEELPVQ